MPSAPVHLYVARLILDELCISDESQYYLGAVAPDSVNLQDFAPKEKRYKAHYRVADLAQWKKNAVSVYEELKNDDSDFAKGVLTHLLTDIFWDELIQPQMLLKIGDKGDSYEALREKKWLELYRFNTLVTEKSWFPQVLRKLKEATPKDYRNIDSEMMKSYRNYLCEDYSDKLIAQKPEVLTEDMVTLTAMSVLTFINENINI